MTILYDETYNAMYISQMESKMLTEEQSLLQSCVSGAGWYSDVAILWPWQLTTLEIVQLDTQYVRWPVRIESIPRVFPCVVVPGGIIVQAAGHCIIPPMFQFDFRCLMHLIANLLYLTSC